MDYQYSFDNSSIGTWKWCRKSYELIHEALAGLLQEIAKWNDLAVQHGAQRRPYEQEENDIRAWIDGADKLLTPTGIEIQGITIGTLRYQKAALSLAIRLKEQELASQRNKGWPSGVLQSLEARIQELRELAEKIKQPPADILEELLSRSGEPTRVDSRPEEYNLFICHASEDKDPFVRPLVEALQKRGFKVWFDELTLTVGASLRRSIDQGLSHCRHGVVVISPAFLEKEWPQRELDGLVAREVYGHEKIILPVWHHVSAEDVRHYSPTLADRVATSSAKGVDAVVTDLIKAIQQ